MSQADTLSSDANAGSTFFDKERDRLLNEVASSLETILSNSNTLNRQLEASIAVGREFEPIAQLWGRFSSVMQAAGIPEYTGVGLHQVGPGSSSTGTNAGAESTGLGVVHELDGEVGSGRQGAGSNEEGGLRRSRGIEPGLPPGVAPGGGVIYGRS
ncbi:Dolichyl-diphosphooligosaccharide-protein glycosyltransferase subunit dad1 [Tilletia horrida]|uniref:DASH complex subunit DAD1 n=1 Tax=Tilletia horrida TaxID=155126 RepID=A0AAN6JVR3_9BASI|nr:Dolichyl-diphosphooligosaccharide-protein glycosyltransferase subunit dad1 [Tilletia horrida]KAK0555664.1 Dolichyl-diphosphooligosaccharide-protein glycosyltransferase subunit dad1 [Tilletia horrida]KAK0568565.1 Dolichyl-diphosphooligosaccharide-protein glycosyltransferase subunit dad1 [Tilletia horrida]